MLPKNDIVLRIFNQVKENFLRILTFKEVPNPTVLSAIAIFGILLCFYTGKISSIVVQIGAVVVEILGK
jgi:hypothetical protein